MLQRTILAAVLLVESLCMHIASNTSDVIVTYAGHAEANRGGDTWKYTVQQHDNSKTTEGDAALAPDPNFKPTEPDDVVFLPNEKQIIRNEDRYHEDVKISDLLNTNRRSLGDMVAQAAAAETEGPAADILFVSGKNNDNTEHEKKKQNKEILQKKDNTSKSRKINCDNLDCNNTVKSVCGGKIEHNKWKYRLFLNECYFRKVNCGFKYENNSESDSELERERERVEEIRVMSRLYRIPLPIAYSRHLTHMLRAARSEYIRVKSENCRNTAEHYATPPPHYFNPLPAQIMKADFSGSVRLRNATSRRSLHLLMDGTHCKHPCPISCTNDYEPECAVTQTGDRRVFLNHCKLDYNSCWNGIYWRKRPMSECVGGKKADMHQNSAFITWMRQAGIVDKKGRLVLGKT